ncbi:MAG: class I SAM-dependent methyltransferase [Methanotrichaceae archaeon]|nr:class I SAM-dependent methyltransferase [Methanotrichaceae archaeon]
MIEHSITMYGIHCFNRYRNNSDKPFRILEVGAGIGTMIERILDWNLLEYVIYTAIDAQAENKIQALERLQGWAARCSIRLEVDSDWILTGINRQIEIKFEIKDFYDFASHENGKWDLIIANAFLDLVDIRSTLPLMIKLIEKESLFYFTINFNGLTILEPVIDKEIDELILNLYHQTMDERLINGKRSGDSQAGRHLISQLKEAGMQILDSGASDWVIFPGQNGYTQEEAYFLHFILNNIQQALEGSSQIGSATLDNWISKRHNQVENNVLIYMAHQIDFVGIIA